MRHAGYRQHARPARSLRSLAASRSSVGGIVTLRQVGSRACPAPSVARLILRGVSILRVGALLLESGVAGVSRGVIWFGGALRAQCLPVAHAAGVPPRSPKALMGLRSLRSRTAYGVPKGRGRFARDKCSAPLSQCIYRQLRSHKAVSCRGFATASRVCRLTESPWRLNYYAGTIGGRSLRSRASAARKARLAIRASYAPLKAVSCRGFAAARLSCRLCSVGSG